MRSHQGYWTIVVLCVYVLLLLYNQLYDCVSVHSMCNEFSQIFQLCQFVMVCISYCFSLTQRHIPAVYTCDHFNNYKCTHTAIRVVVVVK